MSNKILVLGATGNIGSFLVRNLKDRNADYIAGVPAAERGKLRQMNVNAEALDFNDPASLDSAMKGIDSLFMLLPLEERIIGWAKNVVEAAIKNNVTFILRSSIIDAHPGSKYSLFRVHGEIDQLVRDSGIPYSIVHPNSFMQNFAVYYAEAINSDNSFSFALGDEKISYNDVRDIAAVDAKILTDSSAHIGSEYTITGPESLSCNDIAGILSRTTDRTIRYIQLSELQYRTDLQKMGLSNWDIEMFLSIEHHVKDGKQAILTNDVHALTGWAPISFEQFARDYAETWQKIPVEA